MTGRGGEDTDREPNNPSDGGHETPRFSSATKSKLVFPKNFTTEMHRFDANRGKKTKNTARIYDCQKNFYDLPTAPCLTSKCPKI